MKHHRIKQGLPWRIITISAVTLLMAGLASQPVKAAETASANAEAKVEKPKLTERDYLLEELRIAEQQLQREQKRMEASQEPPDKVLAAQRSVIALQRQLVAFDERNKDQTPAAIEKRARQKEEAQRREAEQKRASEEQKRVSEEQAQKTLAMKKELGATLLEMFPKETDGQVRLAMVEAISMLQWEASIEPLSHVVLKDKDASVRHRALQAIAQFRCQEGVEALLKLYDDLEDDSLKSSLVANLRVREKVLQPNGVSYQLIEVIPAQAIPKLAKVARESASRELRAQAIQQLNAAPGEEVTAILISLYDASDDHEFKQTILQFLGYRGSPVAREKLLSVAKTAPNPRLRQTAVYLLGRMASGQSGGYNTGYNIQPWMPVLAPPPPLPPVRQMRP